MLYMDSLYLECVREAGAEGEGLGSLVEIYAQFYEEVLRVFAVSSKV